MRGTLKTEISFAGPMAEPASVVPLPRSDGQAVQATGPEGAWPVVEATRESGVARTLDVRMLALPLQGRIGAFGAAIRPAAVNFTAGLRLPVRLACANDPWAISRPVGHPTASSTLTADVFSRVRSGASTSEAPR